MWKWRLKFRVEIQAETEKLVVRLRRPVEGRGCHVNEPEEKHHWEKQHFDWSKYVRKLASSKRPEHRDEQLVRQLPGYMP